MSKIFQTYEIHFMNEGDFDTPVYKKSSISLTRLVYADCGGNFR